MTPPYPISDHFDGKRFFNPGVTRQRRGWLELLKWRLSTRTRWPTGLNNPPYPPPPERVAPGSVAVTFINHATFLLRFTDATVLTDPVFSERCSPVSWAGPKRARPPGMALTDLPKPDIVVLSHNHYDHMDLNSLRAIQERHAPSFVTALGNARALRRAGIAATELDWWDAERFGALRITATPARHFSARTPFDRNRALWASFMLTHPEGQVLFGGDSATGPHWETIRARLGRPHVALLPVGAYEPRWFMAAAHMNPSEAVAAHCALEAAQSVGMHFGTFQLTDEGIDTPLADLGAARAAAGVPSEQFQTLGFGETRLFTLTP